MRTRHHLKHGCLVLLQTAMLSMFAGSDGDIRETYGSKAAVEAARTALDSALAHADRLEHCKTLFQTTSAGDFGAASALGGRRWDTPLRAV